MTAGLFWSIFVLVAMGWFALGWVARGHENRRYAESRLRALATDAVLDAQLPVEAQRLPEPAPMPAIHVHVETPGALGYRDLAAAAALTMGERPLPPVLETGP